MPQNVCFSDPSIRRPFLMRPEPSDTPLARDVAFRLGALRETFEESGILLHTKITEEDKAKIPDEQDLMKWRTIVHDGEKTEQDAGEGLAFQKACPRFSLVTVSGWGWPKKPAQDFWIRRLAGGILPNLLNKIGIPKSPPVGIAQKARPRLSE